MDRQQQVVEGLLKASEQLGAGAAHRHRVAMPGAERVWFVHGRLDVTHHAGCERVRRTRMEAGQCVVVNRGEADAMPGWMSEFSKPA